MASRSVNKVILLGNLGKDAETKFTPSGIARTTFSVATSWRQKDQQTGEWKEHTDWHNVVLWRSENFAQYLTKGRQVYIEGRLSNRSWEDNTGQKRYMTEVVADEVILCSGRGGEGGGGGGGMTDEYSQEPRGNVTSMPRSAMNRPAQPQSQPAAARPQPAEDHEAGQGITDDDVPF